AAGPAPRARRRRLVAGLARPRAPARPVPRRRGLRRRRHLVEPHLVERPLPARARPVCAHPCRGLPELARGASPQRRPITRRPPPRDAGVCRRCQPGDMTRFGYPLMTEQAGPKDLVRFAAEAERRGFDFEVCSDHYFPWLDSMGHSPYAWSVLGAAAHATERVELMSFVTCPIMRYHPAVVAQKAATVDLLADGRFILGLGAGENLNEHVVGERWPTVAERHDMLEEALDIIRDLLDGEQVTVD